MWQIYLLLFCIIGIVVIVPLGKDYEIRKAMKKYNLSYKFIKENKFYGGVTSWNHRRLENIISYFDNSPHLVFHGFEQYLVIYENKNILMFEAYTGWVYIPEEWIEDVRVTRKSKALKGAIKGKMILGNVGALTGADDWEITIHIITKGFESPNFSLTFKNNEELSNLMYYQYGK